MFIINYYYLLLIIITYEFYKMSFCSIFRMTFFNMWPERINGNVPFMPILTHFVLFPFSVDAVK